MSTTPTTTRWTPGGRGYALGFGAGTASLALAGRTPGLSIAGPASGSHLLLGIDLRDEAAPVDQWLRGDDVTAVYEPADARRLRVTAMWRAASGPAVPLDVTACELVVSAQTSVVESDAALAVVSEVDAAECQWSDAGAGGPRWTPCRAPGPLPPDACWLLARLHGAGPGTALLVAVHPRDARRITVRRTPAGRTRWECRMFSSAIEKGVLLRSRVLAAVGPAASAATWADTVTAAFAASPPVLDA